MWLLYALLSAAFSGTTAVLAKYGIKKVESSLAVALRSVIILAFAWITLLVTGGWIEIGRAGVSALLFPLISGVTNALSWICYFKALSRGHVSSVASVDKAGIALTIVGGSLFLGEPMSAFKILSIALVVLGAILMAGSPDVQPTGLGQAPCTGCAQDTALPLPQKGRRSWLIWAIASAMFTAATTLLAKAGTEKIASELSFAIRTGVMFIIAWTLVIGKGKKRTIEKLSIKQLLFIGLSGLITALAWLFYFKALASPSGQASIVQPIDKLSIWVSVTGAWLLTKEKPNKRTLIGLLILSVGILVLLL